MNSSTGDSQNSEEITDSTTTQSNAKIIWTEAGKVKEEEERQKEEKNF